MHTLLVPMLVEPGKRLAHPDSPQHPFPNLIVGLGGVQSPAASGCKRGIAT